MNKKEKQELQDLEDLKDLGLFGTYAAEVEVRPVVEGTERKNSLIERIKYPFIALKNYLRQQRIRRSILK